MLEPWNDSSVLPPPVNMFLSTEKVDLSALKHVCNNILKVLSNQSPLHKESALCSRFIYKYDKKFQGDIGYRKFKNVHTALKKYLVLNVMKDVENFNSALPSEGDNEKYLPTKQMLEYVMVRIITFSLLMIRICVRSKQSAIFYLNRIKRGESHWMSLLPYALMSRLWSMSRVLLENATTWYANLYTYLSKLELKGLPFLPENYELPIDLEQWLDLKNFDCFGKLDWDQKKIIEFNDVLGDDDDKDIFNNILSFIKQSNKSESDDELDDELKNLEKMDTDQIKSATVVGKQDFGQVLSRDNFMKSQGKAHNMDLGQIVSRNAFKSDQGEAFSRESFKVLLKNQKDSKMYTPNKTNQQAQIPTKVDQTNITGQETDDHSDSNITSVTLLKKFIAKEEKLRNETDKRSLTDHLSFMQWQVLKSALVKLCDELTNRKIQRQFQRVWKEKCLDYK